MSETWFEFTLALITAVATALSGGYALLVRSRHAMRNEMQRIAGELHDDDQQSENRLNVRFSGIEARLMRVENLFLGSKVGGHDD